MGSENQKVIKNWDMLNGFINAAALGMALFLANYLFNSGASKITKLEEAAQANAVELAKLKTAADERQREIAARLDRMESAILHVSAKIDDLKPLYRDQAQERR